MLESKYNDTPLIVNLKMVYRGFVAASVSSDATSRFSEACCSRGITRLKAARYVMDERTATVLNKVKHDNNSRCLGSFR